eukprot:CAMPEP_0184479584 /NCGR_PEP_ID=MMETSP0113_2-20130426/1255_1 /TAXON_ID=91329 /ORGANISM="Norrisiella sphaerica, Strain BC52" /LENGTH=383 /DNA_ID=CAMNT_0026857703 /DNA_START=344 /DNA_END=1495 /DNA_ORIENTATION=+
MIYAHGNGCDIGDMKMELDYFSHTLRMHVCAFELRGYGFNPGSPCEKDICKDIMDVFQYFTQHNPEGKFPHQNIILWGRSIGSGPTTWLASKLAETKTDVAGLILQSPFTSIKAAAQHIAGSMVGVFLSNRWNNQLRIKAIKAPVLIIHGKMDTLIPHSHGEALHAACGSRNKRLHLSETADHNRFDFTHDIIQPVTSFMEELCSNSFNWGDRTNGKCPSELYKIPEYAKKMHLKARTEKKIREIENPGSDLALGLDVDGGGGGGWTNGGAWTMQAGWEDHMSAQAVTAAEILKSLLETTPHKEWEKNEIIQELRIRCVENQKELMRRLAMVEDMSKIDQLLKTNDTLLSVIQMYKDKKVGPGSTSEPKDDAKSPGGNGRSKV